MVVVAVFAAAPTISARRVDAEASTIVESFGEWIGVRVPRHPPVGPFPPRDLGPRTRLVVPASIGVAVVRVVLDNRALIGQFVHRMLVGAPPVVVYNFVE